MAVKKESSLSELPFDRKPEKAKTSKLLDASTRLFVFGDQDSGINDFDQWLARELEKNFELLRVDFQQYESTSIEAVLDNLWLKLGQTEPLELYGRSSLIMKGVEGARARQQEISVNQEVNFDGGTLDNNYLAHLVFRELLKQAEQRPLALLFTGIRCSKANPIPARDILSVLKNSFWAPSCDVPHAGLRIAFSTVHEDDPFVDLDSVQDCSVELDTMSDSSIEDALSTSCPYLPPDHIELLKASVSTSQTYSRVKEAILGIHLKNLESSHGK